MAKFSLELNKRPNIKDNGRYMIYLRINDKQHIRRVKTGYAVALRDWNSKKKVVKASNPDHKVINEKLSQLLRDTEAKYSKLEAEGGDAANIKAEMLTQSPKVPQSPSFLEYIKVRTREIKDAGQIRNWKKYNGFVRKVEKFQTDKHGMIKDVKLKDIDTRYVANFDAFLHTLKNEKDPTKMLHVNSIAVVLNIMKTIIKRAIEIDKLIPYEQNPFLTYKYKSVQTIKDKLDESEINKITALDLDEGSDLWHTRNYFMFSLYCAGIRVGDLIQLRWCNITSEGRITYQMGKNHKPRDLKLIPQAKAILKYYYKEGLAPTDYIFPLLDGKEDWEKAITQADKDVLPPEQKIKMYATIGTRNSEINRTLKQIAEKAGITKNLSFHISRHSFAKMAKDHGIDNSHVKELLAHSNLKTTEGYMGCFDTASNDQALESIFQDSKQTAEDEIVEKFMALSQESKERVLKRLLQGGVDVVS